MSASTARIGAAAKRVSTLRVSLYPFLQSFRDSCTQDGRKLQKRGEKGTGMWLPGCTNKHERFHGAFYMLFTPAWPVQTGAATQPPQTDLAGAMRCSSLTMRAAARHTTPDNHPENPNTMSLYRTPGRCSR